MHRQRISSFDDIGVSDDVVKKKTRRRGNASQPPPSARVVAKVVDDVEAHEAVLAPLDPKAKHQGSVPRRQQT